MQIYAVIKDALDQLYGTLEDQDPACDHSVWNALSLLTEHYENLGNGAPVPYSDLSTQFAYLYKYAGSRACAVFSRLGVAPPRVSEMFEAGPITVTSLGAGPGSDMLGVVKYRDAWFQNTALTFNLVDGAQAWHEPARTVERSLASHSEHADPTVRLHTVDLADNNIQALLRRFQNTSLFTLSYVLSELPSNAAGRLLNGLVATARPGTVLMVIDNNIESITTLLNDAARNPQLRGSGVHEGEITLSGESISDLGSHLDRFNDYARDGHPNIVLNAAWLTVTKL